jgi:putative phosphoribosyl transferase
MRWRRDPERFADREQAGRLLADLVASEVGRDEVVVLALPRGGVPVAFQVALVLRAPLDVLLVRKLGVPWQPELAFGAIASGGVIVVNDDHVRALGLPPEAVEAVADRERAELERGEGLYRYGRPPADVRGRTVVVVDDGIATGSTMRAALASLAGRGATRRIVASPVAAAETIRTLEREADAVICVRTPAQFGAVGEWYDDFAPVSDSDVRRLLEQAAADMA